MSQQISFRVNEATTHTTNDASCTRDTQEATALGDS